MVDEKYKMDGTISKLENEQARLEAERTDLIQTNQQLEGARNELLIEKSDKENELKLSQKNADGFS